LSQFHSSLTAGRRRPAAQHLAAAVVGALRAAGAQCSHALGGDQVERPGPEPVCAPVSAPTGQICTVLPEK
jgi:hypothetical protein